MGRALADGRDQQAGDDLGAARFPGAEYDDIRLTVLRKCPSTALRGDAELCAGVGEIQAEFLVIHPFREGNARTIKLMTDLLAAQTGRPLLESDQTPSGTEAYVAAAKAAFRRDYHPMARPMTRPMARPIAIVIEQALATARTMI